MGFIFNIQIDQSKLEKAIDFKTSNNLKENSFKNRVLNKQEKLNKV